MAAIFFAAIAVVWTYPLVNHLASHVPGGSAGDNVATLWNFWWMRFARLHQIDAFSTEYLFAPLGTSLVLHTHVALPAFVSATVLRSLPLIEAHNVLLLCTMFLNAMSCYLLLRRLTRDGWAAVLGAAVFAGSPFIDGHLQGHFSLLSAWTLPLVCLATVEVANGSRLWAFGLGLLLGGTVYLDYYYALFSIAIVAILLPLESRSLTFTCECPGPSRARLWVAGLISVNVLIVTAIALTGGFDFAIGSLRVTARDLYNPLQSLWVLLGIWVWLRWRPRLDITLIRQPPSTWLALGLSAAVATIVAGPILVRVLTLMVTGQYVSQTHSWRSGPQGIDLATLMLGNPFSLWSGASARRLTEHLALDPIERSGWLGIVPMTLTYTAWRYDSSPVVRRWTLLGAVALIWALGPHLFVFGHNTGVVLPNAVLRYLPIVSNARIPGRAMVLVYLALAVLTAFGLTCLRQQRRFGIAGTVALVAFLIVDFAPAPIPLFALDRPALYDVLRDEPGRGAVLELPLGMRDGFGELGALDHRVLWYETLHERPIVGGFVARLSTPIRRVYETDRLLTTLFRLSSHDPGAATDLLDRELDLSTLRAYGIRFVVVNKRTASAPLVTYVHQLGLRPVFDTEERTLFRVD